MSRSPSSCNSNSSGSSLDRYSSSYVDSTGKNRAQSTWLWLFSLINKKTKSSGSSSINSSSGISNNNNGSFLSSSFGDDLMAKFPVSTPVLTLGIAVFLFTVSVLMNQLILNISDQTMDLHKTSSLGRNINDDSMMMMNEDVLLSLDHKNNHNHHRMNNGGNSIQTPERLRSLHGSSHLMIGSNGKGHGSKRFSVANHASHLLSQTDRLAPVTVVSNDVRLLYFFGTPHSGSMFIQQFLNSLSSDLRMHPNYDVNNGKKDPNHKDGDGDDRGRYSQINNMDRIPPLLTVPLSSSLAHILHAYSTARWSRWSQIKSNHNNNQTVSNDQTIDDRSPEHFRRILLEENPDHIMQNLDLIAKKHPLTSQAFEKSGDWRVMSLWASSDKRLGNVFKNLTHFFLDFPNSHTVFNSELDESFDYCYPFEVLRLMLPPRTVVAITGITYPFKLDFKTPETNPKVSALLRYCGHQISKRVRMLKDPSTLGVSFEVLPVRRAPVEIATHWCSTGEQLKLRSKELNYRKHRNKDGSEIVVSNDGVNDHHGNEQQPLMELPSEQQKLGLLEKLNELCEKTADDLFEVLDVMNADLRHARGIDDNVNGLGIVPSQQSSSMKNVIRQHTPGFKVGPMLDYDDCIKEPASDSVFLSMIAKQQQQHIAGEQRGSSNSPNLETMQDCLKEWSMLLPSVPFRMIEMSYLKSLTKERKHLTKLSSPYLLRFHAHPRLAEKLARLKRGVQSEEGTLGWLNSEDWSYLPDAAQLYILHKFYSHSHHVRWPYLYE